MDGDLESDLLDYPMSRRGCCLIVTLQYGDHPPPFKADLADRAEDYRRALIRLGFDQRRINVLLDVSSELVTKELENLAKQDHSQVDCLFVILICQHGYWLTPPLGVAVPGRRPVQALESSLYHGWDRFSSISSGGAQNGVVPEDPLRGHLRLQDIFKLFRSDDCPSLAGKPKLFFVHSPRELQRLDLRYQICRPHFGFLFGGGDRLEEYIAMSRCQELQLGADFYILYAPLPFLAGASVPNPPLVLAKAMADAASEPAELNDIVLELMGRMSDSGSAEIAMPKALSTLTKRVLFFGST